MRIAWRREFTAFVYCLSFAFCSHMRPSNDVCVFVLSVALGAEQSEVVDY